ncbi:uncharacterized protein LOC108116745 [Drosophila eugracilis]|uniref:uncharacterized protein LOC108116745 n=1 Tax=Drosophila eugracilis TaxID=29029 RepID=UPI0007E5C652|nr:uncharacterized protein LOC108116745 [Drosophila eugracilis]
MPVRLSSARSLNNKWIDCPRLHPPQKTHHHTHSQSQPKLLRKRHSPHPLPVFFFLLLLIIEPAAVVCKEENCSFIEGYILHYVCHSCYVEEIRVQHKDRIPAIGTPYAIWRRSDIRDPSYLLISFYDSPLFSCYTVTMSDGKFYCDGRNYIEPDTEAAQLHCINFPFHYTTHLYDSCAKKPSSKGSPPISVAIAYMKDNIKTTDDAEPRVKCLAVVTFLFPIIPFLLSRYFGILLCQ